MRGVISFSVLVAVTTPLPADEGANARALVDKAVQAVGGEVKLARAQRFSQKAAGKFHGPAGPVNFTGEWIVSLPDQVRVTTDSEAEGVKFRAVKVLAGDKAWLRVNGSVEELDKDAIASEREQLYAAYVATLVPLLKEKDFVLAPLSGGVKVTRADRPDVSLYFDPEKGWLVRVEFAVKQRNARSRMEVVYDDYHDVDGLQRPRRTTIRRDGKVLVESEILEFKPLDKVDSTQFARP
jgi:hypothetical protein